MTDREKVISGLEHCGFTEKRGCDGCPYEDECINFGNDAGHGSICTDALALLREQEQVTRCTDCRYWDGDSGLTVRRCMMHGTITKQFDFCSYGEKVQNA